MAYISPGNDPRPRPQPQRSCASTAESTSSQGGETHPRLHGVKIFVGFQEINKPSRRTLIPTSSPALKSSHIAMMIPFTRNYDATLLRQVKLRCQRWIWVQKLKRGDKKHLLSLATMRFVVMPKNAQGLLYKNKNIHRSIDYWGNPRPHFRHRLWIFVLCCDVSSQRSHVNRAVIFSAGMGFSSI